MTTRFFEEYTHISIVDCFQEKLQSHYENSHHQLLKGQEVFKIVCAWLKMPFWSLEVNHCNFWAAVELLFIDTLSPRGVLCAGCSQRHSKWTFQSCVNKFLVYTPVEFLLKNKIQWTNQVVTS